MPIVIGSDYHDATRPVGGAAVRPAPSLDDLAVIAWQAIIARDYGGAHRDSPADAAQIAYEYAEAFVARRGRK